MDFNITQRDEFAPYTPGGEWITSEEIDVHCEKSPKFMASISDKLKEYHLEWKSNDIKIEQIRPLHHHKNTFYGVQIEEEFSSYITENSLFKILKTTQYDDHIHRTDCFLLWNELKIPIDIKALKSVRNSRHQNKFFWVELHKSGFLFSPKSRSTLLAVEVDYHKKKFVFLDKALLKEYIREKFNGHSALPVMDAPQAFERVYRRRGEKYEWLSFVKLSECLERSAVFRV
jgi:hypothetical protein